MRWGAGSLRWVRPLQSILWPSVRRGRIAGRPLRGRRHRRGATRPRATASWRRAGFPSPISPDYEAKLKRAHVILRPEDRAEHIRHEAEQMAFANGLELVADAGLLAEVAGLVEWPVVLMGEIEARFLDLPPEVLQTIDERASEILLGAEPENGPDRTLRDRGQPRDRGPWRDDSGREIKRFSPPACRMRRFFWENDLAGWPRAGMEDWLERAESRDFPRETGLAGPTG